MRKILSKTVVLLLAILGLWVASLGQVRPPQALAQFQYIPKGNYGAITYSPSTERTGHSNDCSTQDLAEDQAIRKCGESDCKSLLWFREACGALAVGDNGWGHAWAGSRGEAEILATGYCHDRTNNCKVKCWACTARP